MENNEPDNTIKEILEEDRIETRKRKHGRGCLLRLLVIAVLLFIGFYGFVLFRQKMLDLEAEAFVRARQTLTVQAKEDQPVALQATQTSQEVIFTTEPTSNPMPETTTTQDLQQTEIPAQ